MEISRISSTKPGYGSEPIVPDTSIQANNVEWDKSKKVVVLRIDRIQQRNTETHHDYQIRLTPKDIAALIMVLAEAAEG